LDEDEDDDNDENEDDDEDDEEAKLEEAGMFIQEDEGDLSDEEIELHRQDGDHDLFAEEEEEDDPSQDNNPLFHEERALDRGGMRAQDIINHFNREPARPHRYRDPRAQRVQISEDWTEEELTVQRLLTNMRQS
jgi:hypothetical protein